MSFYFEVKPGSQLEYVRGLVEWLDGDTLDDVTFTPRKSGQVTVLAQSGVNQNTIASEYDDGSPISLAPGQALVLWALFADTLQEGDIVIVDAQFETTNSPPRIDTVEFEFRVVDRYALQ